MEQTPQINANNLKAEALRLGFSRCGLARANAVDEAAATAFQQWIAQGQQASMHYMQDNMDKRLDPRLLLPGAKTVMAFALNYFPSQRLSDAQLQFAYYAYGRDYHDAVRQRLRQIAATLPLLPGIPAEEQVKICCDTVPMLDRYWAVQAGLGWIGKNTNLIIPHAGSYFVLGEIVCTLAADAYDAPMPSHCGTCRLCLDACPTGALCQPRTLDASRCLSYLTIENRGDLPAHAAQAMGNHIYGCDRCQQACPHNRFAQPTSVEEFAPTPEFLAMTADDWRHLTREQYQRLFKGSAVKRAKFEGLVRNIQAADTEQQHNQ